MDVDMLTMLQRHRGYQGWRIRPYPFHPAVFLAETSIWLGRGNKKGWRKLGNEKRNTYRTFRAPEEAYDTLLTTQKESEQE
jgi:hypothetical protein